VAYTFPCQFPYVLYLTHREIPNFPVAFGISLCVL
jgi:hypothetical protein